MVRIAETGLVALLVIAPFALAAVIPAQEINLVARGEYDILSEHVVAREAEPGMDVYYSDISAREAEPEDYEDYGVYAREAEPEFYETEAESISAREAEPEAEPNKAKDFFKHLISR